MNAKEYKLKVSECCKNTQIDSKGINELVWCYKCKKYTSMTEIKVVDVSTIKEQAKKNKEVIMKWIEDMSLDGCMLIAETEFLKGQKNGELLMLKKLKKFLEGKND